MRPIRKKSRPLRHVLPFVALALFALAISVVLFANAWIHRYIESPAFQNLASHSASEFLAARGAFRPFRFEGGVLHSGGFEAEGGRASFFSSLHADQLRTQLRLPRLFDRQWKIEEVTLSRLDLELGGDRAEIEPLPAETATLKKPGPFSFLATLVPSDVELRRITIDDANLAWPGGGGFREARVRLEPEGPASADAAWRIQLAGGTLTQAGLPKFRIQEAVLRYRAPSLYIIDAALREGEGRLGLSGEINRDDLDLQLALQNVAVASFLSEEWRDRLDGTLAGDIRIRSPLTPGVPRIDGELRLAGGELHGLAVLDQIATFTGTPQFRRIALTRGMAKFARGDDDKLRVTEFLMESEGLICLRGKFSVENDMIDGSFEVGVTPASLRWLPGSQERVFTASHDGYLWTTMRLTGPLSNPKDDLTPRLVIAAGGALIEGVEGAVRETIQDTTSTILDLVNPLLR